MLALPLTKIEPALRWALDLIAKKGLKLDWVELTDDLSLWERESTRLKWAEEFLKSAKEDRHVDRNSCHSESQPGQSEPGRLGRAQDLLFRRGPALPHLQPVPQAQHPHER